MTIQNLSQDKLRAKEEKALNQIQYQVESEHLLRIRVREVIEFFDTKPDGSKSHVSGVVGIIGEDLGAALFCEYIRRSGLGIARVLKKSPTPGTTSGQRLDRWFMVTWTDGSKSLLQAEIKNWSAQAIGGKSLTFGATEEECALFRKNRWDNQWDSGKNCFRHDNVGKVLQSMKRPEGVDENITIEPLAIYWFAIHHQGKNEVLFEYPTPEDYKFKRIFFFSMSTFLRSIADEWLDLDMPNAIGRLNWLGKIVEIRT